MNKDVLIKYIYLFQNLNGNFITKPIFNKWINILNKSFANCEPDFNMVELYDQEYLIDFMGKEYKYLIIFNISYIIDMIKNNYISYKVYSESEIRNSHLIINHKKPKNFDDTVKYNSYIIITDYKTIDSDLAMINGNHTFEYNKSHNISSEFIYINYKNLTKPCFIDEFSYNMFYFTFDLYYLLYKYHNKIINQLIYIIQSQNSTLK